MLRAYVLANRELKYTIFVHAQYKWTQLAEKKYMKV